MQKKKKGWIILAVIVVIIGGFMICSNKCISTIKKEQENKEQITQGGSRQALILYQDSVSNKVKDSVDTLTQTLLDNGFTVTANHPRTDLTYDHESYELIVFVSPVYVSQVSKPMTEYITNHTFTNNKVFVLINGMLEDDKEVNTVQALFQTTQELNVIKDKETGSNVITALESMIGQ